MTRRYDEEVKQLLSAEAETIKYTRSVLSEEYKTLWSYYNRLLDERWRIFDMYFKIVSVPFALAGAFALYLRSVRVDLNQSEYLKNLEQVAHINQVIDDIMLGISIFFAMAGFCGFCCYVYYSLESANSRIYLQAIKRIRLHWREHLDLNNVLILDYYIPKNRNVGGWIHAARGAVFATFNTSMFFISVWMNAGLSPFVGLGRLTMAIGAFVIVLMSHIAVGSFASRIYTGNSSSEFIEDYINRLQHSAFQRAKSDMKSTVETTTVKTEKNKITSKWRKWLKFRRNEEKVSS